MKFAIVGNGIAGNTAALALRRAAPDSQIDLYASEPHPYYPRPLLPEFLAGELGLEELYFKPVPWYAEQGINLHLGASVKAIYPAEHRLRVSGEDEVSYGRLLLASGGRAWIPPIRGIDKAGVFALRSIDDALAIREYAQGRKRAIVIGCGLLGLEAGRALRILGLDLSMLEFRPRLLPRQLDAEGAAVLQGQVEGPATRLFLGVTAQEVLGDDQALGVRLADGREIEGSLVLVSAGVRSNGDLARQAGLLVERGVVVDEKQRTSVADIWAAGDAAEVSGRVYGIVPAAIAQARVAAANMAGDEQASYDGTVPSTTLKVTGINLTSIGTVIPEPGQEDQVVELRHSDPEHGVYRKLVLKDGRIVGAILLGDRRDVGTVTQLINREVDVTDNVDRLLDEDFDLKSLL